MRRVGVLLVLIAAMGCGGSAPTDAASKPESNPDYQKAIEASKKQQSGSQSGGTQYEGPAAKQGNQTAPVPSGYPGTGGS